MRLFQSLLLLCVGVVFFAGTASAQGRLVATYEVRNFDLGVYQPEAGRYPLELLNDMGVAVEGVYDSLMAYDDAYVRVVGYADATPWKSCRNVSDPVECSAVKNYALAGLRADMFADILDRLSINRSRVQTDANPSDQFGGAFRGVTVFVYVSEPTNIAAIVSLQDELAYALAQIGRLRVDFEKFKTEIISGATVEAVVDDIPEPEDENARKSQDSNFLGIERVDIGVGISGSRFGGVDALTPTVFASASHDKYSVELFMEFGYRPFSSTGLCSRRADASATLGANAFRGPLKLTFGIMTAREMCRNGGSKLNERWLTRYDGIFIGPSFFIKGPLGTWVLNPNLTCGTTSIAGRGDLGFSCRGVNLRVQVRSWFRW